MTGKQSKNVLIIAFHYPPDLSSSGVLRVLKFTRYLPEFGWMPTVLTVQEKFYENTDHALLKQIPAEVEVRRTRALNMKKTFSIRGRYLRIMSLPDRFVGWLPFAVWAGLRLIRRRKIRILYSTSPLASAHLIALTLKFLTGLPWVADFRDPWTEPAIASNPKAPLFRLECFLEDQVVRRADRVIATTSQLRDDLLARHAGLAPGKAVVIPNGYDEEDFGSVHMVPDDPPPVRITHAGLVDESYRSPRTFFAALADLLTRKILTPQQIRVDFLGGGNYVESPAFHSLVTELGLERVVHVLPRVSYAESLARQARSHGLLLLQCGEDTRTLIPAKAFEYLRIGRPVIALVPVSASSELFQRVGGAQVVHPSDIPAIQAAILELVAGARSGLWRSSADTQALANYTRRSLSGRLAKEFETLL